MTEQNTYSRIIHLSRFVRVSPGPSSLLVQLLVLLHHGVNKQFQFPDVCFSYYSVTHQSVRLSVVMSRIIDGAVDRLVDWSLARPPPTNLASQKSNQSIVATPTDRRLDSSKTRIKLSQHSQLWSYREADWQNKPSQSHCSVHFNSGKASKYARHAASTRQKIPASDTSQASAGCNLALFAHSFMQQKSKACLALASVSGTRPPSISKRSLSSALNWLICSLTDLHRNNTNWQSCNSCSSKVNCPARKTTAAKAFKIITPKTSSRLSLGWGIVIAASNLSSDCHFCAYITHRVIAIQFMPTSFARKLDSVSYLNLIRLISTYWTWRQNCTWTMNLISCSRKLRQIRISSNVQAKNAANSKQTLVALQQISQIAKQVIFSPC